jgi:hypothetical protein
MERISILLVRRPLHRSRGRKRRAYRTAERTVASAKGIDLANYSPDRWVSIGACESCGGETKTPGSIWSTRGWFRRLETALDQRVERTGHSGVSQAKSRNCISNSRGARDHWFVPPLHFIGLTMLFPACRRGGLSAIHGPGSSGHSFVVSRDTGRVNRLEQIPQPIRCSA